LKAATTFSDDAPDGPGGIANGAPFELATTLSFPYFGSTVNNLYVSPNGAFFFFLVSAFYSFFSFLFSCRRSPNFN
jgi:hypothetical protein